MYVCDVSVLTWVLKEHLVSYKTPYTAIRRYSRKHTIYQSLWLELWVEPWHINKGPVAQPLYHQLVMQMLYMQWKLGIRQAQIPKVAQSSFWCIKQLTQTSKLCGLKMSHEYPLKIKTHSCMLNMLRYPQVCSAWLGTLQRLSKKGPLKVMKRAPERAQYVTSCHLEFLQTWSNTSTKFTPRLQEDILISKLRVQF